MGRGGAVRPILFARNFPHVTTARAGDANGIILSLGETKTVEEQSALAADQQLVLTCRSANRAHSRWDRALQLAASVAILPSRSPRLAS
jgi:hypothetical protein